MMPIHNQPEILRKAYRAIILDMDDTLYNEMDYLLPAWHQCLLTFASEASTAARWLDELHQDFLQNGRSQLFNRFARSHQLDEQPVVQSALEALRTIQLKEALPIYLEWAVLPRVYPDALLMVLSNGNPEQQANKWRHLNLQSLQFAEVVWAQHIKPKPAPEGVLYLLHAHSLEPESVLFCGDAETDRQTAQAAGIDFIFANDFRQLLTSWAKP